MKEKKSIYRCPVCKGEINFFAGKRPICNKCGVEMEEFNKGIITK